jgi:oligoendopeptidase F
MNEERQSMTEEATRTSNFTTLQRYQPRRFVPDEADLADRSVVVGLYEQLLSREITSSEDLEEWLLDRSELAAAVDQHASILYVRMTCQTDDEARAEAYKTFVETIEPAIKPLANKLDHQYAKARDHFELDADRYAVHDRDIREDIALFREENVPLQTQLSLLSQEYQTVTGAMMVMFDGEERTLQQMRKLLHEPDRQLRERAWRATAERRLQERDKLDDIFDKMLPLRVQCASNAGCSDFTTYQFRNYHRFDYTQEDCRRYHDVVVRRVVPLWRKIQHHRRETMQLDALRPWDTLVDPEGRPPLKPFETPDELVARTQEAFGRTDPELGRQFSGLAADGLLDLDSRKGKAPGGYQCTLSETRKPFIFMNAVGLDQDVRTLLHEGGHAFHALAAADEPIIAYRHAPMEFCEVASMGMELIAGEHLDVFYADAEDLKRSRREHLEDTIMILPWVATIDAFQDWIYAHPDHTREGRTAVWLEIHERFGGVVDWTDLGAQRAAAWHAQLHIFEVPFYYIEYAIAQLGALQLWVRAQTDGTAALADYRKALSLGGSRPLPELFEAAGIKFDFSEGTIAPLMDAVEVALEAL